MLSPEIPGAGINQELHGHSWMGGDDDSSSSDSDDVSEVSELEHFSAMLQKAQQLAVQAQQISTAQKRPRVTEKSRSTLYRQKRARKDLIEKGFYPLAEYVALMEKKSRGMDTQDRGTTRARDIPVVAEVEEAEGGEELLSSLAKNQGKHPTRAHDIAEEEESDGEPPGSGANGQDIHQTHVCGIPSIPKEWGTEEEPPGGLANGQDIHPSRKRDVPGGAEWQEEEEEGSDNDPPISIANSQANRPSHAYDFPRGAEEEEEESENELPSSSMSGQNRSPIHRQSIHDEGESEEVPQCSLGNGLDRRHGHGFPGRAKQHAEEEEEEEEEESDKDPPTT
ncbi:hypothetical protein BGW80DRAFT_1254820 [Lactifluus volemus]|nr:hypothetical protein BGW80DRAFT_1254820 [Lactifluus volemus]